MAPRESQQPADLTIPATAQRTLDWSTRLARSAAWSAATATARPLLVQSSAIPWLSRLAEQPQSGGGLGDTLARRFATGAFRTPETELTLSRSGAAQRQLDAARRSAYTAPEPLPAGRAVARVVEPDTSAGIPLPASPPLDQAARSRAQANSGARPPSQPGPAASASSGEPTAIGRQSEKEAPAPQHRLAVPPTPFTVSGAGPGEASTPQPAAPGRDQLSRSASPALPAVSRQEVGLLRRAKQEQGRPISRQESAPQLGEQRLPLAQPLRRMGLVSFAPEIRRLAQPAALPLASPAAGSARSGEIASGGARAARTTGNMPGQQSIPHQAHPGGFPPLQRVVATTPAARPVLGGPQAGLWTNRPATVGQRRAEGLHAPLAEQPGSHTAHAAPALPLVERSTPADGHAHPPAEALGLPATPLLRAAVSAGASANDSGPDTPPASLTVSYPALQPLGQPTPGLFGSSASRSSDLPTGNAGQTVAVPPDIRLQRAFLAADIGDRLAHTHRGAGTTGSIGHMAGARSFLPGNPLQRLPLAAGAPTRPILAEPGASAAGGSAPAAAAIPPLSSAPLQRAGLPPAAQGAAAATLPATDRAQRSSIALALPAVRTRTHHSQADVAASDTTIGPRRTGAAALPTPGTNTSDTPTARLPLMLPLSVANAPTRRSAQGAGDPAQRLPGAGQLRRAADTHIDRPLPATARRTSALVGRSAQGLSDDIVGKLSEPRDMLTAAQEGLELSLVSQRQAASPTGGLEAGPPGLVEPRGKQPRSADSSAGAAAYEPLDFVVPQSVGMPAAPDMTQAQTTAAGASGASAGGVAELDIDVLAQKVYDRLRHTAQIEQERLGRW